ncbi:sigma E protease regulator RseP [Rheinheimera sp.]|uniref:sigma E protease regulator RseP n=1 Tax=Rheinheimera sp. TaxID=1869214 RepID=UPI0027B8B791|nr:sigma E protease regulator RseP [Rheinheimera sp.]
MSAFVWNLLSFVLALGLLVTVHEFGHFWVARKNGILVKRFSIGFGKTLYSWRDKQGTEFVIAAIPLGGYVRMLDERIDPVLPEFSDLAFNNKSVLQRMAVIVAGPMANFIFAIFVLALMYIIGVPTLRPVVADVLPNSIAATAQLPANHQVVAVNGEEVRDWQAVSLMLIGQIGRDSVIVSVKPLESDAVTDYQLDLTDWRFDPDKDSIFQSLGFIPKQALPLLEVGNLSENSAAAKAGLQQGDKFIAAAGVSLKHWNDLVGIIQNNPGKAVPMLIERNGATLELDVTPESRVTSDGFHQGFLGVAPKVQPLDDSMFFDQRYGPVEAMWQGVVRTWQLVRLSFSMVEKLIFGDVSVKHLSGPISIAQGAGDSAGLGLIAFLSFLALISVNLGVVNLLPLPILDGGHLMYLVVELLTGRPVSEKAQETGFKIGAFVLLMLMGIALLNDISRL